MRTENLKFKIISLCVLCGLCGCLYAEPNTTDTSFTGQSKINRWTLLNSTEEQIRIDTAVELLKDSSVESREILLESLLSRDNPAAQTSVCKAIAQFRNFAQLIPGREDFIRPLMSIIETQPADAARFAAQGLLIFTYRQIDDELQKIIDNAGGSPVAKKNAVYAFRIRSDKEVVSKLIELLDSKDSVVSSAAGEALREWIPQGNDLQAWRKSLRDFENKSRTDILRERLWVLQNKNRQLGEEVVNWQKRYVQSLDNVYQATTDDAVRAKVITESLAMDNSLIKLWALEKIDMWRKSGKTLPLDVFQKQIISLVSLPDSAVRLAAAELLGMLTNVNSADELLVQLKIETDPAVKTELLVSLGHVCNFGLSPGTEIKINPQIRLETLQIASVFLKESNPAAAAEVIRNLLLQNGLEVSQVKPYFELIANAYRKTSDEQVKAHLLEEMSRLCGSDSFYKKTASELFGDIFKQAVDDPNSQIAAPAVAGYIRVNQAGAFAALKEKGFVNNQSDRIRIELISAAGQIGTQDDLEWLGSILSNSASDDERRQAAEAMMNIFQYCKTDVMLLWAEKMAGIARTKNDEIVLSRVRALFEAAEKKADVEKDASLLISIRRAMAKHYGDSGLYVQAAKYYGLLLQSNVDPNEVPAITAKLLDMQLRSGQTESAKQIITNMLLSSDISPNAAAAKILDDYFASNLNSETAKQILQMLVSIQMPAGTERPAWNQQIAKWQKLFADKAAAESSVPAGQK
ncbi:MAG: HEAT repeat domain-containing protein [Sedimentisphaerales bacterium]